MAVRAGMAATRVSPKVKTGAMVGVPSAETIAIDFGMEASKIIILREACMASYASMARRFEAAASQTLPVPVHFRQLTFLVPSPLHSEQFPVPLHVAHGISLNSSFGF